MTVSVCFQPGIHMIGNPFKYVAVSLSLSLSIYIYTYTYIHILFLKRGLKGRGSCIFSFSRFLFKGKWGNCRRVNGNNNKGERPIFFKQRLTQKSIGIYSNTTSKKIGILKTSISARTGFLQKKPFYLL